MPNIQQKEPVDNVEILSVSLVANPAFIPLDIEEREKHQGALFHMLKSIDAKSPERLTAEILRNALLENFTFDGQVHIEESMIEKSELELLSKPAGATGWDKASDTSQYHRYRMKDPNLYSICRVKDFGKGIKADFCQRKDDAKKWEQQNLMFDKDKFTFEQAKEWVRIHKVNVKSIGEQFAMSDMGIDTAYIENRERWEIAFYDYRELFSKGTFCSSWNNTELRKQVFLAPLDRFDRIFYVKLYDSRGLDAGIEFEEVYSAESKLITVTSVTFDASKWDEGTARAWMDKHYKGDVITMTKEEITTMVDERIAKGLEPIQTAISGLSDQFKKFADTAVKPPVEPTKPPDIVPGIVDVNKGVQDQLTALTAQLSTMQKSVEILTKGRGSPLDSIPPVPGTPTHTQAPTVRVGDGYNAQLVVDPINSRNFDFVIKSDIPLPIANQDSELLNQLARRLVPMRGGAN